MLHIILIITLLFLYIRDGFETTYMFFPSILLILFWGILMPGMEKTKPQNTISNPKGSKKWNYLPYITDKIVMYFGIISVILCFSCHILGKEAEVITTETPLVLKNGSYGKITSVEDKDGDDFIVNGEFYLEEDGRFTSIKANAIRIKSAESAKMVRNATVKRFLFLKETTVELIIYLPEEDFQRSQT